MNKPIASIALRAVITADVVKSTTALSAEQRKQLASALRKAYTRLKRALPDALPHPLAIFGGDSWQCYVHDPTVALRAGLYLRAWTRAMFDVDTRFALAIDTVDYVNPKNIGESDGEAFLISGRRAEDLDDTNRLAIMVLLSSDDTSFRRLETITDELLSTAGHTVGVFADHLAKNWTSAQAQAVAWRLLDLEAKNEEIGGQWVPEPVSHQSVSKHLQRAGWEELRGALRDYRTVAESAVGFRHWLDVTSPR